MKYLLAIIASLFVLLPATAETGGFTQTVKENFNPYVGLSLGTCIIDRNNIEADECQQFAGLVGTPITERLALQLEYNTLNGDFTGLNGAANARGDYGRNEWALSALYQFDYEWNNFVPYAGITFGVGQIEMDFVGTADAFPTTRIFADDDQKDAFWGVSVGADYPLTPYTIGFVETGYRSYGDNGLRVDFETADGTTGQLGGAKGVKGIDRSYDLRVGVKIKLFN